MSVVSHLLPNCFSSALEKWLQPGLNLPCEGAGGPWAAGGAGHCEMFSGLHWLCSQSSGLGFKCFLGGAAATYFSNLKKRKGGKLSVVQKCVNPHSRAVILLNKVKLSSVIPVAQIMVYGLCSQMINSNKEKNAVLLTGICEPSWPVTPPHLLGCIFQTPWEDTCLFIETEFHQECQQNVYYDYLLTL